MKEYHPIGNREFDVLLPLLNKLKVDNPNIVEIGVGASTKFFWDWIQKFGGQLTCIDVDQERLDFFVPDGATKVLRDDKFAFLPIDFLFVDGDHRYEYVKKDLDLFLPKMNKGSIICGHDYESNTYEEVHIKEDYVHGKHHGVIKAVNETFGEVMFANSVWWKELL